MNSIDSRYKYSLSQIFSPSLLKKIDDSLYEQNIRDLLNHCKLYPDNEQWNLIRGLDLTYDYLKKNYRCEYVYKNEIANQLLLKFHNDNSATLLKEVASDLSIADIVIINGNTTAYEIKTELDTFDRLQNQIESYQSLYDYVYIVTHPGALDVITKKIDANVGVIIFGLDGILTTIKKATLKNGEFNPYKAVLTLRQSELINAYQKHVDKLPKMGSALILEFCHKWYLSLDEINSRIIFNESLKSRKPPAYQFELIKTITPSLRMLFLGKNFSKKYCNSTTGILSTFG